MKIILHILTAESLEYPEILPSGSVIWTLAATELESSFLACWFWAWSSLCSGSRDDVRYVKSKRFYFSGESGEYMLFKHAPFNTLLAIYHLWKVFCKNIVLWTSQLELTLASCAWPCCEWKAVLALHWPSNLWIGISLYGVWLDMSQICQDRAYLAYVSDSTCLPDIVLALWQSSLVLNL